MRLLLFAVIVFALFGCNSEQRSTGEVVTNDTAKTHYYSVDSVPCEIWDSTLPRQGREPYELQKVLFDKDLNLRFEYYVFKNDGQLFPLKKVVISNDSLTNTLDFKEERKINSYRLGDSIFPISTIGSQLNSLFLIFEIEKNDRHAFIYLLFHDVMGLEYVQPFHEELGLSNCKKESRPQIKSFYNKLSLRGVMPSPKNFKCSPRTYDVYNLWAFTCFYKVELKDSLTVKCIFPENYRMILW